MYSVPKGSTNPIYIVAKTNNRINEITNITPRLLESEYVITKNPFIGGFQNRKKEIFIDISFPISGISEKEVIAIAQNLAQESVLEITANGTVIEVPTTGK